MSNDKAHTANHGNQPRDEKANGEQAKNQKGTPRWTATFRGETMDMNGNVFQLQSEKAKKGQFDDTLQALQRYAARVYPKDSVFLLPIFKDLNQPTLEEPRKPEVKIEIKPEGEDESVASASVNEWDRIMYMEEVKMYLKAKERTNATLTSLYGIVWGQCSRLMQNKCRNNKDFKTIEEKCDVVSLLKIIKTSSHELESHTCVWDALSQAKRRFYSYRQGEHESNTMHVKNLKNLFSIVEYYDHLRGVFYGFAL